MLFLELFNVYWVWLCDGRGEMCDCDKAEDGCWGAEQPHLGRLGAERRNARRLRKTLLEALVDRMEAVSVMWWAIGAGSI